MLTGLEISNFAIVSELSIEWRAGMSTITGETGAGKSIAIDALSLCLGERAESYMVRAGAEKAEISAIFDVRNLPLAQAFLAEHELESDGECVLRRVVSASGRSKAFINGSAVPISQLKQLAPYLIAIHGQHAHQLLTRSEHQCTIVDSFAAHHELIAKVRAAYDNHKALEKEYKQLCQLQAAQSSQKQLLEYQVQELDEFAFCEGEFEQIEAEHTTLSNSNVLIEQSYNQLQVLYQQDGYNALSMMQSSANKLAQLADLDAKLSPIVDSLFEACVTLEEAARELERYQSNIEHDPERLAELDDRLAKAIDLARKHNVEPAQLALHHNQLQHELAQIETGNARIEELELLLVQSKQAYIEAADKLSQSRKLAADELANKVQSKMAGLAMADAKFAIEVSINTQSNLSPNGQDKVDFLVATNLGQSFQPLHKVASGGELSRISLAIEVLIADKVTTPTLIFDEVDVGISGQTASAVGQLLRELGNSTQVICVTHLPQVASSGHNQFYVHKQAVNNETITYMAALDEQGRVDEIARLLGGSNVTQATLSSASELLQAFH